MAVDLEAYAMFDKRKDDPVFMENLLKHGSEIVDSKEGVDKILYAQEISRVLARVAVHERVLAEKEKRPRDEDKYNIYHRTALYIARKGIDIGMDMETEAHFNDDKPLDVSFNYHMSWLFVQYSMMLAETSRYFAAMNAIVNADNYLIHDAYRIASEGRLQQVIDSVKNLPEYKNASFDFTKELPPELVDKALGVLYRSLFDAISDKKLRILFKIYKEVPDRYRDLFAGYVASIVTYFLEGKDKESFETYGEIAITIQGEYQKKPDKILTLPELSQKNPNHTETQDEKNYALWVVGGGLSLSYLDFVPDMDERLKYICDDLVFDFHVPELNLMMEDVMETYAHCRFQIYVATGYESPIANLAYSFSPLSKRVYNGELLLDIYPRLYSILDKLSHIVMRICGITLEPNKDGYIPQPSYNLIVKEIRKHSDGNPYLLTLCEIFDEINPRFIYNKQKDHPFYTMLPEAEHMDRIRHHIIHSGISLTEKDSGKKSNSEMCHITEIEFARRCYNLLTLVKEAIMNTCMAIEYRNRQE